MKKLPKKGWGESFTRRMKEAVAGGVFPGGVLLVAHRGEVLYHESFGHAAVTPRKIPLTLKTLFDLASLTKPLATTTALMLLIHRGAVTLSDPVRRWISGFEGGAKEKVTVFHLLNHCSGLPAWRPYYRSFAGSWKKLGLKTVRNSIVDTVRREELTYPVGSRSLYSDLGFILAGKIVESAGGMRLDQFCRKMIFEPLGLPSLRFRKSGTGPVRSSRFAATERCPWRKYVVQGEVDDGNAFMMDGVAGHAGLFGTAMDVYRLTRAIVGPEKSDGPFLPRKFVAGFLNRAGTPESSWALGWDTPSVPSSSGRFFSSRSVGHLGFTGCSVWSDRDRDLTVVLLTNRIHPTTRRTRIRSFRPFIHDQVMMEILS